MLTKEMLRQRMRAERFAIAQEDVSSASRKIAEQLKCEVDWRTVRTMHAYVPIAALHEIDTRPLLEFIWQSYPAILTAVAPSSTSSKRKGLQITAKTTWSGNKPGVYVPMPNAYQYDVIIVPVLALDAKGYRLGWGGGWYDRFLVTQPGALKIGLGYESSLIPDGIPYEAHDVPLDMVVTEQRVYKMDTKQ